MPMIDLTVPAGSLEPDAAATLLDELATMLLRAEGAPDTEFFREITWVYLHEVPAVAVGGRPGGAPRFRVAITVPAALPPLLLGGWPMAAYATIPLLNRAVSPWLPEAPPAA